MRILLAPVSVQGAGAAQTIINGIGLLNEIDEVDVIIVGRGGGSYEDLSCFNDEQLARAIFRSWILPPIFAHPLLPPQRSFAFPNWMLFARGSLKALIV